ncbi:Hypothetical predicted protein, partial [Marmota monax]
MYLDKRSNGTTGDISPVDTNDRPWGTSRPGQWCLGASALGSSRTSVKVPCRERRNSFVRIRHFDRSPKIFLNTAYPVSFALPTSKRSRPRGSLLQFRTPVLPRSLEQNDFLALPTVPVPED